MMLGMAKVVFSILLSGMLVIGRAMESGKRGLSSSSGWDIVNVEVKEQRTEQGTLGTPCRKRVFIGKGLVNSDSEGAISEVRVNKVNQKGWNFKGN
ncbi:hypothetical protein TNCV_3710081 [Trichonephila clavipes]|nr:hypothetical protein TNCV_3710081 [Trichonephila clavipes]